MKSMYVTKEEIAKVAGTVLDTSSYDACMAHLNVLFPNRLTGYVPIVCTGSIYTIVNDFYPAHIMHVSIILFYLKNGRWN